MLNVPCSRAMIMTLMGFALTRRALWTYAPISTENKCIYVIVLYPFFLLLSLVFPSCSTRSWHFFYSIACFVANLNSTTHMHIRTKSHEKWDGKLHTHAYLICFSNGKTNSLSISYSTNSRRYGNFYYPTILYQIDQNPSGFERGASVRSFFLSSKMFVSKTNVNVKISSTKNNDTMMKTLRNSLHVSDT